MSFASLLLSVLGPVVAIVAVGGLTGPRLGLDLATLSRLAYWVLGPAFVFDLFLDTSVAGPVVARLAVAALAGMVAALVFGAMAGAASGLRGRRQSAMLMTGSYGNVGNAGLAITAFALGDTSLAAAGVLMLTINIAGVTLGVTLASVGRNGGGRGLGDVSAALRRALLSPMPLAGAAALATNAFGLNVPLVAVRAVDLLAAAMIPVMLFTLGLQLAQIGGLRVRPPLAVAAVAKLVVAPAAAAAVSVLLGLRGDDLAAVVLQSAMPPAVFCVLVGIEYDLEPDLVTDSVVLTTVASLFTLPVVLAVVT